MVRVGDIVEGTIESIQSYGLFAISEGETYLITLTELAWTRIQWPNDTMKVGDPIRFKVIKIYELAGHMNRLGSIKQACPEDNPWKDPFVYSTGNKFIGEICQVLSYGMFIKHPAGEMALMHISDYDPEQIALSIGDCCEFEIIDCDVEAQRIRIRVTAHNQGQ